MGESSCFGLNGWMLRVHVGHAMNKILKDMINRFQVLQGRRVQ